MTRLALPETSEEASVVSHAQLAVPKGIAMVLWERAAVIWPHHAVRQYQQGLRWQCIRMLSNPDCWPQLDCKHTEEAVQRLPDLSSHHQPPQEDLDHDCLAATLPCKQLLTRQKGRAAAQRPVRRALTGCSSCFSMRQKLWSKLSSWPGTTKG